MNRNGDLKRRANPFGDMMTKDYRWKQMDHVRGVYIVGFGKFLKIGWSSKIGGRLRAIEESLPQTLLIYRYFQGKTLQDERMLHSRFSAYRLKQEWFSREGELAAFAGDYPLSADEVPDCPRRLRDLFACEQALGLIPSFSL